MNDWIILKFTALSGQSKESDNSGQTPRRPKYSKTLLNTKTRKTVEFTDLDKTKYKRNTCISAFTLRYTKPLKNKTIEILSIVVMQAAYPKIGKFINTFSKKLKRKGIEPLGYCWVRDVGDIKAQKHFHLLMATSPIDVQTYKSLFHNKKHSQYEVQKTKTNKGMQKYLKSKEVFAATKERSWSKSRTFRLPKKQRL